jgi:hypothetical protein
VLVEGFLYALGRIHLDGRVELLVHKVWRHPPPQRHLLRPANTMRLAHIGAETVHDWIRPRQVNIAVRSLVCSQRARVMGRFFLCPSSRVPKKTKCRKI